MKNQILYIIFYMLFLLISIKTFSQGVNKDSLFRLSTQGFGKWARNTNLPADSVLNLSFKRLSLKKDVDNEVILYLIKKEPSYPARISLISKHINRIPGDIRLKIELLNLKSVLQNNDTKNNQDTSILKTELELDQHLKDEYNHIVKIKYQNHLNLGKTYLRLGNKTEAEIHFIEVLQFPFYQAKGAEMYHYFKDLYIQAAIGQMDCHRGALNKLNELIYAPATYSEVLPTLNAYIVELGGKCTICNEYFNNKN